MRPTTGEAYTDGRGAFRPTVERVEPGAAIRGERVVRADACVIGTGAGGGPVAKELAEGGMRVVMLEEGERVTTDEFTARPRDMIARHYREAGQTTTVGNVPIVLPLGSCVGGTTVVNSGTCFRTPAPVPITHASARTIRSPAISLPRTTRSTLGTKAPLPSV